MSFQNDKAVIFIEESDQLSDVTFPTNPVVMSLRHYGIAARVSRPPNAGYPVVCVTVSNIYYLSVTADNVNQKCY